jgi:hypothetical protein
MASQNNEEIGKYINRADWQEDTDFVLKSLNDVYTKFKQVKDLKVDLGGASTFKTVGDAAGKLKVEMDELQKIEQQLIKTYEKRQAQTSQQALALTGEKEALRQKNVELKNTVIAQESANGSIRQMRAELNLLTQQYDALSKAERDSAKGKELQEKISSQSNAVKDLEFATQRYQRNVGNYQGSSKIIVDALSAVEKKVQDLKEKQQGLVNLSNSNPIGFKLGRSADELNQVNAQLKTSEKELTALNNITSDPKFFTLASKVGDARTEVRGFTRTLIQLEQEGLGNTSFAVQLRKQLAELTDQVADTREEIKAMSSDSRSFDQLSTSVSFLANTYQTFIGIQALAGDQSEETQQTIKKLVAVQAVANGLQQISEQLTQRGTLINKGYAFVQDLLATATDRSAAASLRLAAATKLLLGGLIIGAIVLIVLKMNEWAKAADEAGRKQKVLNDVSNAAADSYGKEKAELDILVGSIRKEGATRKDKLAALKELQEKYPGYFDNIKTEKDLNEQLATAYEKASQGILLKAKVQAASDLLSENESKRLKSEVAYRQRVNDLTEYYNDLLKAPHTGSDAGNSQVAKKVFDDGMKIANEEYAKNVKDIQETSAILTDAVQSAQTDIEKLGGTNGKGKDKEDNSAAEQLKKDLQAQFDIYKLQKERDANLLKEMSEDEKNSYDLRLLYLGEYLTVRQRLIADTAEFEKKINKLSNKEKEAIDKKSTNEQITVATEASKTLQKIEDDRAEHLRKLTSVDEQENTKMADAVKERVNEVIDAYKKEAKGAKDNEKQQEELAKQRNAAFKQLGDELKGLAFDLFTASIEREKNAIQGQMDALDKKKAKDIEVANATITNAQEKAAAIATIEARAQAQKEQLELRQRQLDEKKARFEKAHAIVDIIQSTVQGVLHAIKDFPGPGGLALAAVIGAVGAAQLARVISQPIPHYATGTMDHPGGLAMVGDGGRSELVVTPKGELYQTPSTNTLVDLPKHSVVLPDANTFLAMSRSVSDRALSYGSRGADPQVAALGRMEKNVVNAIKNIPQPIIKAEGKIKRWTKLNGGDSLEEFINKNF